MKDYVLMFRMDITTVGAQPTPEQMKLYIGFTAFLIWQNMDRTS
jgi:hypothetical protein